MIGTLSEKQVVVFDDSELPFMGVKTVVQLRSRILLPEADTWILANKNKIILSVRLDNTGRSLDLRLSRIDVVAEPGLINGKSKSSRFKDHIGSDLVSISAGRVVPTAARELCWGRR